MRTIVLFIACLKILGDMTGQLQAGVISDFSNGLADWTVQSIRQNGAAASEIIVKPNGAPIIEIATQANGGLFANPPWTVLTSNALGTVSGDFDIAVSFAGGSGMNGVNSFGLVFGYVNPNNFYMAHVFPGFGGSAFRLEKVVNGIAGNVFAGSSNNHNVGFTWSTGNNDAIVTPDALRIRRVGNTFSAFAADTSAGGWLSFSQSTWTDSLFPALSLAGFGERFDGAVTARGGRFAVFGEGTAGIATVLASTDISLANSTFGNASVPEPSSLMIFGICALGLVAGQLRRRVAFALG
jgi:hypothetical protein